MIEDSLGRTFKKLRLSLNSICNFACTYCVSEEDVYSPRKAHTGKSLSAKEFAILVSKLHSHLKLKEVRLTGYLLSKLARDLKLAGLDSMNISLDAVNPEVFSKMSRGKKIEKTLEGIFAVKENEIPFKLNATIMKGYNEQEILSLLEFSGKLGVTVRYLELMKMGHLSGKTPEEIFTEKEILDSISKDYSFKELPREKSSTAKYWITKEGYQFGIIANESSPFCGDCNRLRLDSQGSVYGCLSSNHAFSIREAVHSEIPLEPILYQALLKKQDYQFSGSSLGMMSIGG